MVFHGTLLGPLGSDDGIPRAGSGDGDDQANHVEQLGSVHR